MSKLHSNILAAILIASLIILTGCKESDPPKATIGEQVWTIQNYDGTHYQNGDCIPEVKSAAEWEKLKTGAWCYYENDETNGKKYGRLYNLLAINDKRGFAPKGWHIPTNSEWIKLVDFLGGPLIAALAMKSNQGWNGSGNGTNSSKLNCLPGGIRSSIAFSGLGNQGLWWTSTKDSLTGYTFACDVTVGGNVYQTNGENNTGMAVRLIKDIE